MLFRQSIPLCTVKALCQIFQKRASASSLSAPPNYSAQSFYEKYPYQKASDILEYINDCDIMDGKVLQLLNALDEFSQYYPMYKLSTFKAEKLKSEIVNAKPKHILELGSFFGYSALNIVSVMGPGTTLTCVEGNPENAKVATQILRKGLATSPDSMRKNVRILNGLSTKILSQTSLLNSFRKITASDAEFDIASIFTVEPNGISTPADGTGVFDPIKYDFIFLDHDKDSYLTDLLLLERCGLMAERCTVVADNVLFPGAPGFLEYLSSRSSAGNHYIARSQISGHNTWTDVGRSKPPPLTNGYTYSTRLVDAPFERVGFETQFSQVPDAMSVSVALAAIGTQIM